MHREQAGFCLPDLGLHLQPFDHGRYEASGFRQLAVEHRARWLLRFRFEFLSDRACLQVHPKFGAGVEEAGKTQSRVCRHRALAFHDSRNRKAIASALIDSPRGLRNSSFNTSPGWAVTRLGVATALVVVDDFDIGGPFLSPGETDAPLVIDPDGVLATTDAGQRFEPVCWW